LRGGRARSLLIGWRGAQVSPTTLFFIEGCGQLGGGAAMNWGDGFITDRRGAA
jgi:hypothetical protein